MDYRLEILLSFLKIIPPLILITFISLFFIKLLKFTDFIENIIIIFLLNWIQIVLSIEILSIFKIVTLYNLIIFYSAICTVCIIISIRKKINYKIDFSYLKLKLKNFYNNIDLNKILFFIILIFLIIILVVPFFMGLIAPPSNYDSMTYHLARAAFWKQNHTINHYFTGYIQQLTFPVNAEIGFLWLMIFTNSGSILFIVQWLAFLMIIITIYKLLRNLNFSSGISFITSFVFSTFDIAILESYSTQNDHVTAIFIVITTYLLLKIFKTDKIEFKYIILAGFSAGLAIGTKGYAYLFIPGFILFLLLYGKNNIIKYKKIGLVLIFSIVGIILFASYNLIMNYISFGNPIIDENTSNTMSFAHHTLKIYISNLIKHIVSFYQLNGQDYGIVSNSLQKLTNLIHSKLGISLNDPSMNYPFQTFRYSELPLNYDDSYFGPFFFLIIMPLFIYNSIIVGIMSLFKKSKNIFTKYKDIILITIIPISFFLAYVFIFKWHQWAGRYMIAFAALLTLNLAVLLEILKNIKFKHLITIITVIILIMTSPFAYLNLFYNNYMPLHNSKIISKIFSPNKYDYSRGGNGVIKTMIDVSNELDNTLGINSRLGVILIPGDWVYIYFGRNLTRYIKYLDQSEFENKSIQEILDNYNLDGILINTNATTFPIAKKFCGKSLLKINSNDFNKYFKPLNQCEFNIQDDIVYLKITGDDPYFESTFPLDFKNITSIVLNININVSIPTSMQVFYKQKDENYKEENSIYYNLNKGNNEVFIPIYNIQNIEKIRIDPVINKTDCSIKKIEIFDLVQVKNKKIENYYLLYK